MEQPMAGMILREKDGVKFLSIPSFERAGGVTVAFSTRIGGVSPKPFDTLNFSRKREESDENFEENFRRFAKATEFDADCAVGINFAHSGDVYRVRREDTGRGIFGEALPQICDGLVTDEPGIPLLSFHADCVPLFFYDPKRRAAAVCHAGWRGVTAHMAANAVQALADLGCEKGDILAAIGPCISVRHFEVGEEVRDVFSSVFGSTVLLEHEGRLYVDLNKACLKDMVDAGLNPDKVSDAALCTYEDEDMFYSHRRDNGKTGAMAAIILIKDK
jgi:YfiH family protein